MCWEKTDFYCRIPFVDAIGKCQNTVVTLGGNMKKIGFIGAGNMGGAIIGGILKSKKMAAEDMIGADHSRECRERAVSLYGIEMTGDNRKVAAESEILFFWKAFRTLY